jgi:hypothetical protein
LEGARGAINVVFYKDAKKGIDLADTKRRGRGKGGGKNDGGEHHGTGEGETVQVKPKELTLTFDNRGKRVRGLCGAKVTNFSLE